MPVNVPERFRRVNQDLLRFLPPDARVIVEIGCGAGALASAYRRANPGVRYVGVESDEVAADTARKYIDHVLCGEIGDVAREALAVARGSVDVLVFGETLERLADPWAMLNKLLPILSPGGQVIASVTNAQYAVLSGRLLVGDWRYGEGGQLDRAHLRFFTLDTVFELFAGAEMRVFDVRPLVFPSAQLDKLLDVLTPAAKALGADPAVYRARAAASQYVVRSVRVKRSVRPLLVQAKIGYGFGSAPVRVTEPEAFLNTVPGVIAVSGTGPTDPRPGDAFADKVFVWQRVPLAGADFEAHRELIARGYVTVFEVDDDLARPDLAALAADDGFYLRVCHAVQTSTEELADRLRKYNPNVAVFPNQIARLPSSKLKKQTAGPVTVFFGSLNPDPEWAELMPAINRVAGRFADRVRFRVVADRAFFDALTTPHKTFTPACDRPAYLRELAGADVALLPLRPTAENRAKSDVKFQECAALGVVALASPTVYAGCVADGKTGLLFADPGEFEAKLTQLVEDGALRMALRTAAFAGVKKQRMLGQHFRRRLDWYRELASRRVELTLQLKTRVPGL